MFEILKIIATIYFILVAICLPLHILYALVIMFRYYEIELVVLNFGFRCWVITDQKKHAKEEARLLEKWTVVE